MITSITELKIQYEKLLASEAYNCLVNGDQPRNLAKSVTVE